MKHQLQTICALALGLALFWHGSGAALSLDPDGLVTTETTVAADSVTVGQRFVVTYTFTYPDSLRMLPWREARPDKTRQVGVTWDDTTEPGRVTRTARRTMMTVDLAEALVPEQPVDFTTPSGDTIRVFTREVTIPVRHIATASDDLRPLKEQWEAPRSYTAWIVAGALAVLLVALAWWMWWRRHNRVVEAAPEPQLPADYVALTELARIEKMQLLDEGAFKRYYTLVVDVVRRYLEARFNVEAMDRTTEELLDDLESRQTHIDGLGGLLREADLVKFAKHQPLREDGETALRTAREIIARTARPKLTSATDQPPRSAAGGGD